MNRTTAGCSCLSTLLRTTLPLQTWHTNKIICSLRTRKGNTNKRSSSCPSLKSRTKIGPLSFVSQTPAHDGRAHAYAGRHAILFHQRLHAEEHSHYRRLRIYVLNVQFYVYLSKPLYSGSHVITHLVLKYPHYNFVNYDKLDYCATTGNLAPIESKPNYKFVKVTIAVILHTEKR